MSMPDQRCIHELLTDQCDLCKPRPAVAVTEPFMAPLTMNPGPWFGAQYGGTCDECGDRFDPGDSIRAIGGGQYECRDCGEVGR